MAILQHSVCEPVYGHIAAQCMRAYLWPYCSTVYASLFMAILQHSVCEPVYGHFKFWSVESAMQTSYKQSNDINTVYAWNTSMR